MPAFGLAVLLLALATARPVSAQQVELRAFMGGQHRPDVVRSLLKDYMAANPGVKVTVEVGGATSELHQRYLSTVLTESYESIDA
ncbi:MAG: hypothetical protein ACK5UX_15410, partial [Burkholderiales bacterium]